VKNSCSQRLHCSTCWLWIMCVKLPVPGWMIPTILLRNMNASGPSTGPLNVQCAGDCPAYTWCSSGVQVDNNNRVNSLRDRLDMAVQSKGFKTAFKQLSASF